MKGIKTNQSPQCATYALTKFLRIQEIVKRQTALINELNNLSKEVLDLINLHDYEEYMIYPNDNFKLTNKSDNYYSITITKI